MYVKGVTSMWLVLTISELVNTDILEDFTDVQLEKIHACSNPQKEITDIQTEIFVHWCRIVSQRSLCYPFLSGVLQLLKVWL